MAKLNLTREKVEAANVSTGKLVGELIEDWLTLHDENEAQRKLLREVNTYSIEHKGGCHYLMPYDANCTCGLDKMIDKIRALIGGE